MEGEEEGWRDFCRPAVQKTKLWDVFPYPFSDPWQKVSARQWLGASCHEGQASFSVRVSWSIAFIQPPCSSCSILSRKVPTVDSVPVSVPSGNTWSVWFSGRTWLEYCKDAEHFSLITSNNQRQLVFISFFYLHCYVPAESTQRNLKLGWLGKWLTMKKGKFGGDSY